MSSRGRRYAAPEISLGLEEEVEFGSDEDMLDHVGEIALPEKGWYPGKPPSPVGKGKTKSSSTYSPSDTQESQRSVGRKGGLLKRGKKESPSLGIGEARIISVEEVELTGELARQESRMTKDSGSLRGRDSGSLRGDRESLGGEGSLREGSVGSGTKGKKMFSKIFGGGKKKEEASSGRTTGGTIAARYGSMASLPSVKEVNDPCES